MAEQLDKSLAGVSLETWFVPNITSDVYTGIGAWSDKALISYLSTGNSGEGSQAGGLMLEAINKSFSHLSTKHLSAIATNLCDVLRSKSIRPLTKRRSPQPNR